MTSPDRALRRYLRREVTPYSPALGPVLRDRPVRSRADLDRLPLMTNAEFGDGRHHVLRPTVAAMAASGDPVAVARILWARLTRRQEALNRRVIEPRYRPVHWLHVDGVPVGYSHHDVRVVADLGRAAYELAGVDSDDVVVGILPTGPHLPFWQLALGAHRAGMAALWLGPDASPVEVARLGPTVLAGRPADLQRLLERGRSAGLAFGGVRTILAAGEPLEPDRRERLRHLAGHGEEGVAVVNLYAPPGVRAMWSECRGGTELHTWPGREVVELIDPISGTPAPPGADGEVVWTPIGWRGTVGLRVRTGMIASIDDRACVSCGRPGPRLRVVSTAPAFGRVLEQHPAVVDWQAELRTVDGHEELIVFLALDDDADLQSVLRQLDHQLSVTQFVVLDRPALDRRLAQSGDERVIDRRRE